MLDIWVANLRDKPERKWAALGNLQTIGTPPERVSIKYGMDSREYESYNDVIRAIQADGFEGLIEMPEVFDQFKGFLGYTWSFLRIFREIADGNSDVLVIEDDHLITGKYNYADLNDLWGQLPDPKIAMLSYNLHPDFVKNIPFWGTLWYDGAVSNGTSANIYSPEGAADILARCLSNRNRQHSPEMEIRDYEPGSGVFSHRTMIALSSWAQGDSSVIEDGHGGVPNTEHLWS